jgi:hypothetical protein
MVKFKYNILKDESKKYKEMSNLIKKIESSMITQKRNLDWKIPKKDTIDDNIEKIIKNLNNLSTLSNTISNYLNETIDIFQQTDIKQTNKINNLVEKKSYYKVGSNSEKLNTDKILKEYQVEDDEMVEWKPKILGFVNVPFLPDSYNITKTEAELLNNLSREKGLVGLKKFKDIEEKAFDVSDNEYKHNNFYPDYVPSDNKNKKLWVNNDGHRDAFRHAYWNALLTSEFGEEWTENYATAHEGLPGNPSTREAMDLYNNEVGRNIAIENPDADDEELADLVKEAVENGEMLVVNEDGELIQSNEVELWHHGITPQTENDGVIKTPDGEVYPE